MLQSVLQGHLMCWIFPVIAKIKCTPLSQPTRMISLVSHFPILHPFPFSCWDSPTAHPWVAQAPSCPVWDEPRTPCLPLSALPVVSKGKKKNPTWGRRGSGAELWVSRVKTALAFPVEGPCFLINSVKNPKNQQCSRGWKWPSWKSIIGFGEGKPVSKEKFLGCLFLKG